MWFSHCSGNQASSAMRLGSGSSLSVPIKHGFVTRGVSMNCHLWATSIMWNYQPHSESNLSQCPTSSAASLLLWDWRGHLMQVKCKPWCIGKSSLIACQFTHEKASRVIISCVKNVPVTHCIMGRTIFIIASWLTILFLRVSSASNPCKGGMVFLKKKWTDKDDK